MTEPQSSELSAGISMIDLGRAHTKRYITRC